VAANTTHAWAELFVPGAGWLRVDPTNRQVGGHNLIPVAVGRCIDQFSPISGSHTGPAKLLDRMTGTVDLQRG